MIRFLLAIVLMGSLSIVWCTVQQPSSISPNGDNPQLTGKPGATSTNTNTPTTITSLLFPMIVLDGWSTTDTGEYTIIGCNDKLISKPIKVTINENSKFSDIFNVLIKYDPSDENTINPWKGQDKVIFESYEISDNQTLIIKVTWWIKTAGECDTPRLLESLKALYKPFGFNQVELLVDGQPISHSLQ